MNRVPRSIFARIGFKAVYACKECENREGVPRFGYRFGDECRCPRCGTSGVTRLRERDAIDRMQSGLWNLAARLGGGKLYHCNFCRLQFYDRRPWPASPKQTPVEQNH